MMKENFRRKQYFSIRKYTKGACSVLLGTSLFLSLSYTGEAKATEEKEVCIHAVDNSSLSEQIRSQLKVFEENKIIVEEGKSYYFVYKKNNVLPSTGGLTSGTTVLGGALLLVCLTLIKKKKGKLIFLVSMLTVSGNLSQAMASSDFEEISPVVVKVVNGGMLPSPEEISGYSFTGYYFEIGKTCVNNSNSIKIEERGEFAPGLVEEKVGEEKKVVVSEKGDPLVQEEKPEGVVSEKGDPLVQPEKPEGVVSEKGDPLVQPEKPEAVISEKGEPLVQSEKPEGVVSEKGDPLVQSEKPEAVISEKGDPLVQPEKPEGVVSEKGDPLVQEEKPEGVVSEKGDPLVQEEKPEAVISEKGDPLVQPEKLLASWNGPTLVREENPIAEVSIKGDPLVQPENPEWKPTPEQPTPEVTPKPVRPADGPKGKDTPIDIHGSKPAPPVIKEKCKEYLISEQPVSDEKLNPLNYKTTYKADSSLRYKEKEDLSCEIFIISVTRDESTGKEVEKIIELPRDKVISVGNVEKIVKPIEITEERKDDPELPKGMEVVIKGEQGEITITRTYEVNPETGELTNPKEVTEITRLMIPKVIYVGTKE